MSDVSDWSDRLFLCRHPVSGGAVSLTAWARIRSSFIRTDIERDDIRTAALRSATVSVRAAEHFPPGALEAVREVLSR